MGDGHMEWLVSMFSGLVFSNDWRINAIRIFFFTALILIWFLPAFVDLSVSASITFAFWVSICIFLIKLILAILNVIVNHTVSIPKAHHKTRTKRNLSESEVAPEGIPQELWDLKSTIPHAGPVTENVFADLIARGFDPNVVVQFIQIIVPSSEQNEASDHDENGEETTKEVLEICGKEFTVPFNRKIIDSLFGANYSFIYVFIVLVFSFFMCLICAYLNRFFKKALRIWLCFIYGPALYSTLHPPEVDAYSTTRGDYYTGITRPLSIIIIAGLTLYFLNGNKVPDIIIELQFPIPMTWIVEACTTFFYFSLIFFPLWSLIFLGHPTTMINWLFEWISRYLFGHSGATGVGNSIVLFVRSTVILLIILGILTSNYNRVNLAIGCGVAVGFLQIPMKIKFSCHLKSIRTVFVIIGMSFIAFISCYVGCEYSFQSGDALFFFSLAYTLIFDVTWPYTSAVGFYFLFSMRFLYKQSKTINTLRLLTPCLIAPLILGITFTKYPLSPLLTAFIIIMCIHKTMTEPYIFSISLILQRFTFNWEIEVKNTSIALFYAMMLVRKMVSVSSIMDYYMRVRLHFFANRFELFDDDSVICSPKDYAISLFLLLVPLPDRIISTLSLVWSVITGAPYHVPQHCPFVLLPFPPRPNSFWNQVLAGNIDITRAYLQHQSEHPIETPVYTSMAHSLTVSLSSLVHSGRLGIVSSNSFFLFLNEPLAAFVHIISLEPNAVNFQLRGLEYNDETICHLGELARLKNDVSSYHDYIPNFSSSAKYFSTDWKTCAIGVKLWQYNITRIDEENAFIGVDRENMSLWSCISLAKHIAPKLEERSQPELVTEGELPEKFIFALDTFSVPYTEAQKTRLKYIWDSYVQSIFTDDALDLEKLFDVFHGSVDPLFQKAAQSLVLYLSLVTMQLGPDENTTEAIIPFVNDMDIKYFVSPVQNAEFNTQFELEQKDLVAYEDTADGRSVLFFRQNEVTWDVLSVQKEVVRSYWASEAFLQMFLGEDNSERLSIQEDDHTMRNLIVQASDIPIGYPALVSPISMSYSPPPNYDLF